MSQSRLQLEGEIVHLTNVHQMDLVSTWRKSLYNCTNSDALVSVCKTGASCLQNNFLKLENRQIFIFRKFELLKLEPLMATTARDISRCHLYPALPFLRHLRSLTTGVKCSRMGIQDQSLGLLGVRRALEVPSSIQVLLID